ncbi:MAG: hypothetical protein NTU69_08140 [Proteobacteria bacterium]|nr:hypothetical protein [Pseudomonadota bacterium]
MSIKDLRNKIDKLENFLNVKEDTPAQWALDTVRALKEMIPKNFVKPYTEEDVFREALELTQKHGTLENYNKAFLDSFPDFNVRFRVEYCNCDFKKEKGLCDICLAPLTDCNADFCQKCHEKYPEEIKKIVKHRKQQGIRK